MTTWVGRPVGRRWVVRQTGRGVLGFAILGLAACSSDDDPAAEGASPTGEASSTATTSPTEPASPATPGAPSWARVDLGFVSAYVLVRGGEAAIVDTGVGGSAGAIGSVLQSAGAGWDSVRHVILTHKHRDHAGSIGDVLDQADSARGYAGAEDLSEIDADLSPLADEDEVFGLQVVATPGHTPGHLALFEPEARVLVAGDALNNDGRLSGANPQFSEDMSAAAASVRKLAALGPRTIFVGHGDPLEDGAAEALRRLAET